MKKIKLLIPFLILFSSYNCVSQQLVETVNDAKKILENKEQFKNKPLKELLKEIKPQIKWAVASGMTDSSVKKYFIFNFVDWKQKYYSLRPKNIVPMTIVVYVKEDIEWDHEKRPQGKETVWTAEDAKKYGNLTMIAFRVYGDADTSH